MSAPVQPVVHTPGPWEVKGPSQNGHCRRIFAGDEYVAIVGGSDQPMKTIRANADLVAAAPDLLAACLAFIECDNQCGANLAFVMAQDAVKKAGIAARENGGQTCDMKHGPCSCGATH